MREEGGRGRVGKKGGGGGVGLAYKDGRAEVRISEHGNMGEGSVS